MGYWAEPDDWLALERLVSFAQGGQVRSTKRQLLDHVVSEVGGPTRRKDDLVVFTRIECHESDFATVLHKVAVADNETEKLLKQEKSVCLRRVHPCAGVSANHL